MDMKKFKISSFAVLAILFAVATAFTTRSSKGPESLVVYANTKAIQPMPTPPPTGGNGLLDVTTAYNSNPTVWRNDHCTTPNTPTCVAIWNTSTNSYSSSFQGTYQP